MGVVLQTQIPNVPRHQGKVRDIYDLGDRLVLVATDRISAFDWILPNGIPDKGKALTALTLFWLDFLQVPNHLITTDLDAMGEPFQSYRGELQGRTMMVRKTEVIPVECVARGYLAGSGWKEYQQNGTVCGIPLPQGLKQADRLPEPIFTPATKAISGHDENISFEQMIETTGRELAEELRDRTLDLYKKAAAHALDRGIILADTKLEWGRLPGSELLLIDEVFTSDSSRYWPLNGYTPGQSPPSYDKQFVRDWLETTQWDKASPPPELPEDVVARTREKYLEGYQAITGAPLQI